MVINIKRYSTELYMPVSYKNNLVSGFHKRLIFRHMALQTGTYRLQSAMAEKHEQITCSRPFMHDFTFLPYKEE